MKKFIFSSLALSCAFALTLAIVPAVVFAHDARDVAEEATTTSNEVKTTAEREKIRSSTAREKAAQLLEAQKQRRENQATRLDEAKLRLCEARAKNITNIMNRAITRGQNQVRLFGTITERVKAFYVNKAKTLANYDELVAAVDAAKVQAESDLEVLKTLTFSCDSDDPKGEVAAFKAGLEEFRHSLKDYRTAVKDLIVGVKSVQGDES
jgi:hypothetical protein